MSDPTFQLSVVTPERVVLEATASSVTLPAYDGQLGILARRAPLLARLGAGKLSAETSEGRQELFVDGGFAQMVDDRLTVLTERAGTLAELDRETARQDLEAALALPARDDHSRKAKDRALTSARARLRLAP